MDIPTFESFADAKVEPGRQDVSVSELGSLALSVGHAEVPGAS
jgi:hypothetical protein